jgi:hypothetical protein
MKKTLGNFESKSLRMFVLTITLLAVVFISTTVQVQAARDDNWLSQLGNAQNAGRDAGQSDAENGYAKSPNCNGGAAYCAAYNWGYNEGYDAVELLNDN